MVDEVGDGHAMTAATAAVAWHLRLPTADASQWQAFTAWLEADPAHAAAYDALALSDAELDGALAPADWSEAGEPDEIAANDRQPVMSRWWSVAGISGLAAAGIAAVMLQGAPNPSLRFVETPAGVRSAVVLVDGTQIEMNGGTRLGIDDVSNRLVMLEKGEAVFRVTHDVAHPFVVQSGGMRLEDVGTVFNVSRVGPHLGVQVAEGAVLFQPERDRIMLTAGAALSHMDGESPRMSGVAVDDVGSWRQGRLVFRQTPVRLVAAALERSTGTAVNVAEGLQDTPFTGSIGVIGGADRMVPRAAALIGARAVRNGRGWTLERGVDAGP